uniref:Uncharacterized protein n=1 Tax=Panstrongylus lignarius TaxID=156445 RepID=A0A224XTL1_9HEMI
MKFGILATNINFRFDCFNVYIFYTFLIGYCFTYTFYDCCYISEIAHEDTFSFQWHDQQSSVHIVITCHSDIWDE